MAKYIVRPNQRVTHGTREDAIAHFSKMPPGQTLAAYPPPPLRDYYEGDEIELTDQEAAQMPHAICTSEEYERETSPKALMEKGYTQAEAESMVASAKAGRESRAAARKLQTERGALPYPSALPGGGMAPTDGSSEPNPRAAGKFPEDSLRKPQK